MIARAGNGAAVFVAEAEKPDHKLMSLIRAAAGPPVEDLTIDWGIGSSELAFDPDADEAMPAAPAAPLSMFDEAYDFTQDLPGAGAALPTVQQYPPAALMSTLLPGFRVSFYALAAHAPRSRAVVLSGTIQGQPLRLEVPVSPLTPVTAGTGLSPKLLHLIAARALIQGHEDAIPVTDAAKDEVRRLGLTYGLASSQTSFVAVDDVGDERPLIYAEEVNIQRFKAQSLPMSTSSRARMSQLPHSLSLSTSSGSATLASGASPALSELSLYPTQHPAIERYIAGGDVVVRLLSLRTPILLTYM